MKKTLTINLNGSVFHIDEDAFQQLNSYLNAVDKHFPNAEDKEILRDIEARISELFSEKLSNRNVVELADVEDVINVLGQPNQFSSGSEAADESTKEEPKQKTKKSARKLYRDIDHQVFGGVLAGLSAYFGFDVVWLRILAVVCVFFGFGSPILLYIIAWIIMPEAKTAAQKLEMRGEEVTVDSIKNFFESEQLRENAGKVGSKLGEIFLVFAKIFLVFFGVISIIIGFSIILGLFIASIALLFSGEWLVFQTGSMFHTIFWVSAVLVCLIPAIGMFIGGIRLVRNRRNPQKTWRSGIFGWSMFALWFISLLVLIACSIRGEKLSKGFGFMHENHSAVITENRHVSGFNKISANSGFVIEIVEEDTTFLEVANANCVKTYVEDSVLYIKPHFRKNRFWKFWKNNNRKVVVHSPKIKEISAENACEIYSKAPLKAEKFTLNVENACEILLDVEAQNVKIDCENACGLNMKINSKDVRVKCENACNLNMKFKSQNVRFDCENAIDGNFEVDADNLKINAGNGCDIDIHGVTKKITANKKNGSNINTSGLSVLN
ncbi:MAG: PspC domain-containing protein [Prevotellaceae bacterium]|jgi:phage shock protein PspC (stress-responsive transcriptional regulator)|nr:PspC domain-containing protein [Prevotellaceae bacterium]